MMVAGPTVARIIAGGIIGARVGMRALAVSATIGTVVGEEVAQNIGAARDALATKLSNNSNLNYDEANSLLVLVYF